MSGIYATSVSRSDAGTLKDNQLLVKRSRQRGSDDQSQFVFLSSRAFGPPVLTTDAKLPLLERHSAYQFLGCAYSAPASPPPKPEFLVYNEEWALAIDGTVAGFDADGLLNRIANFGWESFATLPGQYEILGYRKEHPAAVGESANT